MNLNNLKHDYAQYKPNLSPIRGDFINVAGTTPFTYPAYFYPIYPTFGSLTDAAYNTSISTKDRCSKKLNNNNQKTESNQDKAMSPDIAAPLPIANMELSVATATATAAGSTVAALQSHFPLHYPTPGAPPALPPPLPPPSLYGSHTAVFYGSSAVTSGSRAAAAVGVNCEGNTLIAPIIYSNALHTAHAASYLNTLPPLPPSPLSPNNPQHHHHHHHHQQHHHLQHPFANAYLKIIQTAANDCHPYNGVNTLTPLLNGNFMVPPPLPLTTNKISHNPTRETTTTTTTTTMTTTTATATTSTTTTMPVTTTMTMTTSSSIAATEASILKSTGTIRKKQIEDDFNCKTMKIGKYTKGPQLYGATIDAVGNQDLACNGTTLHGQFKIPNGRELSWQGKQQQTRYTKSQQHNQQETNDANRSCTTTTTMRTCNSVGNFMKGAYIELSNGSLRRVEDMRTEDFIQCAERSLDHRLIESTVVKISTSSSSSSSSSSIEQGEQQQQQQQQHKQSNRVVITFSYDRNRSKADIEVTPEHPFFVYGQGWASYNPDLTMTVYSLKCQRLQVGDICISLTQRETVQQKSAEQSQKQHLAERAVCSIGSKQLHKYNMPPPVTDTRNYPVSVLVTTTATASTSTSTSKSTATMMTTVPTTPSTNSIHLTHNSSTLSYTDTMKMLYPYPYTKDTLQQYGMPERSTDIAQFYYNPIISHYQRDLRPPPLIENHRYLYLPEQDQPLDVSISRKRRWSAPEHTLANDNNDLNEPRRKLISSSSTPAPTISAHDNLS